MSETAKEAMPATIGARLRTLAQWFDVYDNERGYVGEREVQASLRADADTAERAIARSERLEKALKEIAESGCHDLPDWQCGCDESCKDLARRAIAEAV